MSDKLTPGELRVKMARLFEENKAKIMDYAAYAQLAAALNDEYHAACMADTFGVKVVELTEVARLDARETPASLDKALESLRNVQIKQVVYDRKNSTYTFYV